jgi:hypothetical protein
MASLEDLARKKFADLSAAEEKMLRAAPNGTVADCSNLGGGSDPAGANGTPEAPDEKWPETRNIRADLIRWLCIDREARGQVDPKGVWIRGARTTGYLDLSFTNVLFPLVLWSCRLEQDLNLRYAKLPLLGLAGSWTEAIGADGLKLEGDILLRNGFHANGEVRLLGATIGGNLDAAGGTFKNPSGNALNADRIEVHGNVFLNNKFVAAGQIRVLVAEIKGQLAVVDAWLDGLDLESTQITGPFLWRNVHREAKSDFPEKEWKPSLDLTNTKVGALIDPAASWPEKGQLRLDGFVYDRIAEGPTDAKTRLKWLRLQPDWLGFYPQPYKQLAKVLSEMGHDHGARHVLVEMEDARRKGGKPHWWSKSPNLSWPSWVWAWLLKITIGSGYLPFRAGWWVAAFVLVGFFLFSWGQDAGVLTPTQDNGIVAVQSKGGTGIQNDEVSIYQPFNGFIYSLETFLPLVDLQFAKHWLPCASCKPKSQVDLLTHLRHWPLRRLPPWHHDFGDHFGKHLRWYFWFHILAGWFFTTMFVAGVTGLVRKD